MDVLREYLRSRQIRFIVYSNDAVLFQGLKFPQGLIHHRHLRIRLRRRSIDHMQN